MPGQPCFSVFLANYMATAALHDLQLAVRTRREDLVCHILKRNEKLNINSSFLKTTVLSLAVLQKSVNIVELLLNNGADPNKLSQDPLGRIEPPIFTACRLNQLEIASMLLERGADPNATNYYHHSPLWAAVMERNIDLCEMLIAYGANLNQGDKSGQCALNLAIKYCSGREKIAKLLIAHGANVDFVDGKDRSSLAYAIYCCNATIVDALLKVGVTVSYEVRKQCCTDKVKYNPSQLLVTDHLMTPKTLQDISIIEVRRSLMKFSQGTSIWPKIEQLSLPQTLRTALKIHY
uniref:Ankyrin repeat and SOCS box protein 8 n=1 Tax=Plectus sambesii TaxID=2011161 RepID=A0A914XAP3_9BILA